MVGRERQQRCMSDVWPNTLPSALDGVQGEVRQVYTRAHAIRLLKGKLWLKTNGCCVSVSSAVAQSRRLPTLTPVARHVTRNCTLSATWPPTFWSAWPVCICPALPTVNT